MSTLDALLASGSNVSLVEQAQKREEVKKKAKKLLLGRAEDKEESLDEQAISSNLTSAVGRRPKGGLLSENPQRQNAIQMMLLVLYLNSDINGTEYDRWTNKLTRPGQEMNATKALANPKDGQQEEPLRTEFRPLIVKAQQRVGATADGDLGHGSLDKIEDWVSVWNSDKNRSGGGIGQDGQSESARDIVIKGLQADDYMTSLINDNVNAAGYYDDVMRAYSTKIGNLMKADVDKYFNKTGGPNSRSANSQAARTTVTFADRVEQSLEQATSQATNTFWSKVTTMFYGGIAAAGTAVLGFKDKIAAKIANNPALKEKLGNAMAKVNANKLPIAVLLALGVGGAFGFRRYLKNRKNRQLARQASRDSELMRMIDQLMAEQDLKKYKNTREAVDMVQTFEAQELRNAPYMRGY